MPPTPQDAPESILDQQQVSDIADALFNAIQPILDSLSYTDDDQWCRFLMQGIAIHIHEQGASHGIRPTLPPLPDPDPQSLPPIRHRGD